MTADAPRPAPGGTLHGRPTASPTRHDASGPMLSALIALALVTAAVCAYVDYSVYRAFGLDSLDSTISAEASLIGAVLAVAGALVGVWTYLKPKWTVP